MSLFWSTYHCIRNWQRRIKAVKCKLFHKKLHNREYYFSWWFSQDWVTIRCPKCNWIVVRRPITQAERIAKITPAKTFIQSLIDDAT